MFPHTTAPASGRSLPSRRSSHDRDCQIVPHVFKGLLAETGLRLAGSLRAHATGHRSARACAFGTCRPRRTWTRCKKRSLAPSWPTRLVKLGKEELAYATPLAQFAVRRVRTGRTVGGPVNVNDVTSPWCQRRRGICIESLHEQDGRPGWREMVVEDRHATPADIAATRIDFEEWLGKLPRRQRAIAEVLATGEETGTVARRFGLTPGRVSQIRRKLHNAWCRFQGEAGSASGAFLGMLKARAHPRGRSGRIARPGLLRRVLNLWLCPRAQRVF